MILTGFCAKFAEISNFNTAGLFSFVKINIFNTYISEKWFSVELQKLDNLASVC
jgi:hypothetical protein